LSGRPGLCICRVGRGSFSEAFERNGISKSDFERLFEEQRLDGKQSNLNSDLKRYLKSHSYVLYAWADLRHLSDPKLHIAPNLISASGPNEVVRRFMEEMDKKPSEALELSHR
jgi:hypothetical protein